VKEAEAGRARADAMVDYWKGQLKRIENSKTIEPQVIEESRYQLRAAEAGREEVDAKVQSTKAAHDESVAKRTKAAADVTAAKARQGVAEADRRRMAALVSYAKIRAPFAGIVTKRNVDTGAFLQPAPGSKADPLLVVARTDKVKVFVDVPETAAPLVSNGAQARIRVQALGEREFSGVVTRTSWALDPKARTLRAEIDLPNPAGKLRPGMYAYVTLTLQSEKVLTLPRSAVQITAGSAFCYLWKDGKQALTEIRIGMR